MNPLPDEAVRALLAQIGQGDQAALETLHRRFARRVHAFVLNRCRDACIADTIVGDTFYEVWKKPGAYRGESSFSTWLLGIARFKMLSALRGTRHFHDDVADLADELASESPTAERQLEQSQDANLLHRCLKRLSAIHRECLHLVYFEELPVPDVAALQGVPEGTVKTRLFHARAQMRTCLQEVAA